MASQYPYPQTTRHCLQYISTRRVGFLWRWLRSRPTLVSSVSGPPEERTAKEGTGTVVADLRTIAFSFEAEESIENHHYTI
jgi:hypothetical protein